VLFPQEEKPSIAIVIFFIFSSSDLSAKDTVNLKINHKFAVKRSKTSTKELKKLKSRIKRGKEGNEYMKMYYICPETHERTLFFNHYINKFMEVKKSPKADLEGKKSTWLLVGYVVVLAFMFVAFEWTQRDVKIDTSQAVADVVFEEEIIPITETPEQAAPPPPEAPKVAELLEIVDDKADIEETTTIINEDNQARVEVKYVPVQVVEEEPEEQTIFEVVENMPDFPGGQAALMQYLAKNIKYPTIAQENGTQGRVIVQFVVNRDGSIVDAKVVRSVDPYLDKEALRVINTMPKWKPGMQRGKPVRVKFTVPVMFRLQ
jgi:protein TonB